MRKRIALPAALLIAGAILLFLTLGRGSRPELVRSGEPGQHIRPAPVRIGLVFRDELIQRVSASGAVEARRKTEIKSQISAPVRRVFVNIGQSVKKGETLVILDDREYQVELLEAKAKLSQARLEYALLMNEQTASPTDSSETAVDSLKAMARRAQADYHAGVLGLDALLKAERDHHIQRILDGLAREELIANKSGLAEAEARYARAMFHAAACTISAPLDGIVGGIQVCDGDIVSAQQILMQVVDLRSVRIRLHVMEEMIRDMRVGETILAEIPALPDTVISGRIIGIDPIIEEMTRSGCIICEIPNTKAILKAGMYVSARLIVSRKSDCLLVPREAIVERNQRKLVFAVRNDRAFWCHVETGSENAEYVEIMSSEFPLNPGDTVIVDGHFALSHDVPVAVMNKELRFPYAQ